MLNGPNITLRLFNDAEVDEFVSLRNVIAEQEPFLPPRLRSNRFTRKHFEDRQGWWDEHEGQLAIVDKTDRLLGGIGFFRGSPLESGYELGYELLRRADRGKGYMTEAVRIFSAYLFELKPVPRLQIITDAENTAARRVAEKCGYQLEGTMRKAIFCHGRYVDLVIYSLMRDECVSLADALKGK